MAYEIVCDRGRGGKTRRDQIVWCIVEDDHGNAFELEIRIGTDDLIEGVAMLATSPADDPDRWIEFRAELDPAGAIWGWLDTHDGARRFLESHRDEWQREISEGCYGQ